MKRVIPIILVCTFLLYLCGIQVIYWLKVENAKEIAQSFIRNNDLKKNPTVAFTFTSSKYNSLSWTEKGKEFSINGQDFDVINVNHLPEGSIEVECYADNLETEISNAFRDIATTLFSGSHNKGDTKENDLLNKIAKEYMPLSFVHIPEPTYKNHLFFSNKDALPLIALILSVWRPPSNC